jgi:hypothetical protein
MERNDSGEEVLRSRPFVSLSLHFLHFGRKISLFGVATDLLPTFLDAAGLTPPPNMALDGMSLMPGRDFVLSLRHRV